MEGTSRVGTVPHVCQESIDWLALACCHGGGGRSGQTEAWKADRRHRVKLRQGRVLSSSRMVRLLPPHTRAGGTCIPDSRPPGRKCIAY
jgi:hypothetical protein